MAGKKSGGNWHAYSNETGRHLGGPYRTRKAAKDDWGRDVHVHKGKVKTLKNPKMSLPKQWTAAQVRVNPQGKVQVKIAANKVTVNPKKKKLGRKARYDKFADTSYLFGGPRTAKKRVPKKKHQYPSVKRRSKKPSYHRYGPGDSTLEYI